MRKYRLERNANGMITQCENADGGNIYAQREEINKKAMENLQRPTPGKLGNLSNLQIFNFNIADITTGSGTFINTTYNTTSTFPANATQTVMFGVSGINNKALYYNVLNIKAQVSVIGNFRLASDSIISFYALQNNETSTSSLGTKIPQPAPLSGNGGGAVTYTTSGNIYGAQSLAIDLTSDSVIIPSDTNGLRCSGLALKQIYLSFEDTEDLANVTIDVEVLVDTSSVSTTY